MNFSIIINTHNQPKFIYECIKSCKLQNFSNYEIIVVDTSEKVLKKVKSKKVKYFHIKQKSKKFPVINQMYQIFYGLKKSKGKFICLLDGDDKFDKSKLKKLSNIFKKNNLTLNQDIPIIFSNFVKYQERLKRFKINSMYRNLIICWPQIFGTSTLACHRDILKLFFKTGKPFKWEYLAIDVKLVLFAMSKFNFNNRFEGITLKRKHDRNLDKTFSNIFTSFFWKRRMMQIEYNYFLTNKKVRNLDFLITKLVNFFL